MEVQKQAVLSETSVLVVRILLGYKVSKIFLTGVVIIRGPFAKFVEQSSDSE
jgi:hypothetical protein